MYIYDILRTLRTLSSNKITKQQTLARGEKHGKKRDTQANASCDSSTRQKYKKKWNVGVLQTLASERSHPSQLQS